MPHPTTYYLACRSTTIKMIKRIHCLLRAVFVLPEGSIRQRRRLRQWAMVWTRVQYVHAYIQVEIRLECEHGNATSGDIPCIQIESAAALLRVATTTMMMGSFLVSQNLDYHRHRWLLAGFGCDSRVEYKQVVAGHLQHPYARHSQQQTRWHFIEHHTDALHMILIWKFITTPFGVQPWAPPITR